MNKYEIIGIVGEGAYGIVYKAKNKESGQFGKYSIFFAEFFDFRSCGFPMESYCLIYKDIPSPFRKPFQIETQT